MTVHTHGQLAIEARRYRVWLQRSKLYARDFVRGSPQAPPCNCRLNRVFRHVTAGTFAGRHRTFPGGWEVNREKPYRTGSPRLSRVS